MLRSLRANKGWSQAKLAANSGVSRASISAIENARLTPSVTIALALAQALDTDVEHLFGTNDSALFDKWTGVPGASEHRFWRARVGKFNIAYPVESLPTGTLGHDGQLNEGRGAQSSRYSSAPENTLVMATCDPLVGLLREQLALKGIRLIPLLRTSRSGLRMLERGLVHVAGIHFGTTQKPDVNLDAALRLKTASSFVLLRYATWNAGLAAHGDIANLSVEQIFSRHCRWVNRPEGSSARASFDALIGEFGNKHPINGYEYEAPSHQAVATIVSTGSAQAGWTLEATALQRELAFHPVHADLYDLCFSSEALNDHRIQALLEIVQNSDFRASLDACPGIQAHHTGEIVHARL
jgi:putative molybdopterin biosynthesis protein